ncbi:B-cell lymphoma 3-encoded protein [Colletotrichum truncatum]|uniref:B-cell lymphoma 3-encoded protein n=1 Tax=Colletotrichum truncatum TaxID=5467 RepID=A0ACC3YDF5_COLTU
MTVMRRIPDSSQAIEFALIGNIDGLKHLFKTGQASTRDVSSTRGYTLLRWALYGNQWQTSKFLMQAGCDPDYHPANPIEYTPRNKALDVILQGQLRKEDEEALRPVAMDSEWIDDQNYSPLHKSVLGLSSISIENALLQCQDDLEAVDAMGRSALFWAASRGDDRTVAILLASGADPNNIDYQLDTPLAFAADNGHTKCVRLLLEAGADTEPKRPPGIKFSNPLNRASRSATDPLTLKTLLDFGSDIESCGIDGRTPLIHVARRDNVSFALLLLEYGANINATSITGQTPLTTAITHNSHGVLQLLLDRWFEYSQCPRLSGGHLLQVVTEYADLETIKILVQTDHLHLKYDHSYGLYDYEKQLKDRIGTDEKLESAFKELMTVINTDPYQMQGPESLAEAGLLAGPHRRQTDLSDPGSICSISSSTSDEEFVEALEHLDLGAIQTNASSS